MTKENQFQASLIAELNQLFPGCMILKNDPNYLQGIPDLIILWGDRWAALEVKANFFATYQPNQEYYIDKMADMSFAAMICPENREEVLDEVQQALGARR